jgi:nicotinamidase-related amidase
MNTALLVIDMQVDLCRDVRRAHLVQEMLSHLVFLIERFERSGALILYSQFLLNEDDEQFRRFGDKYCIAGTPGSEIIPELLPLKGSVITKKKHSAFYDTELDEVLRRAGISTLCLAGLQTHICIMTTAADASFRGYRAVAVKDCVVSSNPANKNSALTWIAKYVGDVLTSEEVIGGLEA